MRMATWVCGIISLFTALVTAQPSSIFYDDLDASFHAEIKTFVSMYTHLLIHGEPATGAQDFSFTRSEANSPLFQPYVAYMRTLAKIKGGEDIRYFGHLVGPADVAAYSEGTLISTSMSEPAPTINHVSAIVASNDTVQASVTEGTLSSVGLGVQPVESGTPYVSPMDPPEFEAWMDDLASLASNLAAAHDPTDDVRHMLLGEPTNAEDLRSELHSWLEIERPYDAKLGSYVIHVMFGKFGALPVVVISYESGYLLVDGVNGSIIGPFLYEDEIDASPLLAAHPQHSGSGSVSNIDVNSSSTVVLARDWYEVPPRGYVPDPSCTPAGCWLPRQPTTPTGTPSYNCTLIGNGNCKCTTNGTMTSTATPPGPPIPTKIVCVYPSTGGDCNANGTPPGFIPPPADCTQTYYYAR